MPYIHHLLGNTTFFHDLGTAVLARFIGTSSIGEEVCLHKGATCRVRTGDQWLPDLCHCQLGQDIPITKDSVLVTGFMATQCMSLYRVTDNLLFSWLVL